MNEASIAAVLSIIAGLSLVFFGRRIFWVFVGMIGFIAGMHLAPMIAPDQPQWVILVIGIVCGIVGAVLAILLQRVAVAIAGWSAGGILASRLAAEFGLTDPTISWVAFVIGAVIAAVIISLLFDWALIVLTTLSGALLVCDGLAFPPMVEWMIGAVLVIVGILVQARDYLNPRTL